MVPLPPDVQNAIVDSLVAALPSAQGKVVPALLETASGTFDELFALALGLALLLWSAWSAKLVVERRADPMTHPSVKALNRYGPVQAALQQIDNDLQRTGGGRRVGRLLVLGSHILAISWYRVTVMRLVDVVWLYRKVTKHSVNFIPTGRTHEAVIHDCFGTTLSAELPEADVNTFLEEVCRRSPWAFAGHSDAQVQAMSDSRREQTIRSILSTRDAMIRRFSTSAP